MNVMVKTSDLVKNNKKVGELSVTSLDELCDALKVKCGVSAENVAIYLVRSLPWHGAIYVLSLRCCIALRCCAAADAC
eukprot:COSAG06_NODE_16164_length_1017_cov_34.848584_2_plen_78_part_00